MLLQLSADAETADNEMRAILFVLIAFAYIDGSVHFAERTFIRDEIDRIVDVWAQRHFPDDAAARASVSPRWKAHFYGVASAIENDIRADFEESVTAGETAYAFVYARLKLRCLELLGKVEQANRAAVLGMIDELMMADGIAHPAERHFQTELSQLMEEPTRVRPRPIGSTHPLPVIEEARPLGARTLDHPFFSASEHAYVFEATTFAHQAASDIDLLRQAETLLIQQRAEGQGRLEGVQTAGDVRGAEPFMDGHVCVHPVRPGIAYELLVIGDLHGCYSCLKAALLQADFLAKVEAHHAHPERNPYPLAVFLGDYIDRGHYSYDGVLRTAVRLLLAAPGHVVLLRGNHEHYVERDGLLVSPVRPAEAIASIARISPPELLLAHMRLFDRLPSALFFDRILFTHAGIPRDDTIAARFTSLGSLSDAEIRLQMAWSDPSDVDFVPLDLQRANTRFAFGRMQFRTFMSRLGCTTLIRGHERLVEGFRRVYAEPDFLLLSLFSAGGRTNSDLPRSSNYRDVSPMALLLRHESGRTRIQPFPIAYERWNDPAYNGFLRSPG